MYAKALALKGVKFFGEKVADERMDADVENLGKILNGAFEYLKYLDINLNLKLKMRKVLYLLAVLVISCTSSKKLTQESVEVYKTDNLIITKLSESAYKHISFLNTQSFGRVQCNGMIVINNNEAMVFDTPTNDEASDELINWLSRNKSSKIIGVVPTHFHADCLGGLPKFHQNGVPSYANTKTIEFAKRDSLSIPENPIEGHREFNVGNLKIETKYFGAGHTKDNIVAFVPKEKILFGGCLVKELDATKGYLGDADTLAWPKTIKMILKEYPEVEIVIPGHGKEGNKALLEYTSKLFSTMRTKQ